MFQGYLTVKTMTANGALPVSGASVSIINRGFSKSAEHYKANPSEITFGKSFDYCQITDENGKTTKISMETPNPSLTYIKGGKIYPYSVCDVYIKAENYIPAAIIGVQIYGELESLLPVKLEPFFDGIENCGRGFTDAASGEYVITHIIPPPEIKNPNCHRNHLSFSENDLPEKLKDIYIPETISVHLSEPGNYARNIYENFADYIKNVASSEIYPTWSENVLRANIHAQISFALNRIFTDWYPCRGFDFQITSLPDFDQTYIEGRNIFANIEVIVNDIFNSYVRRTGKAIPLFTDFCDGLQITNKGMPQWDSLELAISGYTPLKILKHYYGKDIELITTDKIAGIRNSYSGTPLAIGSVGEEVEKIQKQLMAIRKNYHCIPLINCVSGRFGSDTDAAVRRFQSIFNLPVDGIVNRGTGHRLSYIHHTVMKLSEITKEGKKMPLSKAPPSPPLSKGSKGNSVLLLQYLTNYISLFYQYVPTIKVDGIFWKETENAVIKLQDYFGLLAYGIVGQKTWEKLLCVYKLISEKIIPSANEQDFPDSALECGSSGEPVRLMQDYLNLIADSYPVVFRPVTTGVYEDTTKEAVTAFQKQFSLNPTGIIDEETRERIIEVYNFISKTL